MSFDRNKQLSKKEIDSMNIAVNDTDIRSIHPDKMEEFAEYLVRKLKEENLMKPEEINLTSTMKMFEYEKMSREIEECNDVKTLKEMLRCQVKLYMKLQETITATSAMQ